MLLYCVFRLYCVFLSPEKYGAYEFWYMFCVYKMSTEFMAAVMRDDIYQVLPTLFCFLAPPLGHRLYLWVWMWASNVRAGVTLTGGEPDAHHNTNIISIQYKMIMRNECFTLNALPVAKRQQSVQVCVKNKLSLASSPDTCGLTGRLYLARAQKVSRGQVLSWEVS